MPIEQFCGTEDNDISFVVVNKDGQRYIEATLPRKLLPQYKKVTITPFGGVPQTFPIGEIQMYPQFAFMDSMKTYNGFMGGVFDPTAGEKFTITPVTAGVWDGSLTISNNAGFYFNNVVPADVIRWFNPIDFSVIDLTVTAVQNVSPYDITVTPSEAFPSAYASDPRLYLTKNVITGLDHLNGESVSIMVDGYLVCSPLNTIDGYPTATVSGGSVTLPNSITGALVHVGRPIVADIKTLPATTVEQSPTTIESLSNNKTYVKVHESRGLFIANKFPEEIDGEVDGSSVENMESLDDALVPQNDVLIGNKFLDPVTKRVERCIPGSWENQGVIALRQVDPLHFEIISIIDDLTILARSDRR